MISQYLGDPTLFLAVIRTDNNMTYRPMSSRYYGLFSSIYHNFSDTKIMQRLTFLINKFNHNHVVTSWLDIEKDVVSQIIAWRVKQQAQIDAAKKKREEEEKQKAESTPSKRPRGNPKIDSDEEKDVTTSKRQKENPKLDTDE
jgi:hypothetical protein